MRNDFDQVLRRNMEFASEAVKRGVLIQVTAIDEIAGLGIRPLEAWNFPGEALAYMDACIEQMQWYWSRRRTVRDDLLPSLKPFFGIAEHTAFVGGRVVYGGDTSYHEHPLKSLEDVNQLACHEDNENFSMLMRSMAYLKERSGEEGFIASLRGGEAPMDMANGIRGNDLFMDFYDNPEKIHELIAFCTEASKWTFNHQHAVVGQVEDGTMTGMGVWIPGHSIGHLSEDASCMCSADLYRDFGRPYTESLLEHFDCAMVHVHTYGRHVLPEICAIDKVKFVQLEFDPNQPSPIETFREYDKVLAGKVVIVRGGREEIEANLDFLTARKCIIWATTGSVSEARTLVDTVRRASDF